MITLNPPPVVDRTVRVHLRRRRWVRKLPLYVVLIVLAAITLAPLAYGLSTSLKSVTEALTHAARLLPTHPTWGNFDDAWVRADFSTYLVNSVLVTGGVVVVDLVASSMLGYVLARNQLPGQRLIEAVLIGTLFVGVTTALLYPQYTIARSAGIANLAGMILVEYVGVTVVHTYLIKAFVQGISPEIEESARLDGCGLFRTWWHIALPLMRPMMATTIMLAVQASWNNYQVPLAFSLTTPRLRTLTVGVSALRYDATEGVAAYPTILAGAMIGLIPIALTFLFLQRYFVQGWTEGAIK